MENNKTFWPGWETARRIGSGGFGTVYEIQRDVYGDLERAALKVITIPHSEDEVDYLRCTGLTDDNITQTLHKQVADIAREYKLMAQMRDNPNIVRCDDFQDIPHEDGLGWDIYIKMELLTPLMKCLDKVQTEKQILKLGMDICNALIACQEKNIIHRDIKPQNIFISDKGQFKLGDFGIARTAERTTRATAGIGTYSYMAPEVEKNEAYGKTADIYSLGLVLYWLLNEKRSPFLPLPPEVPGYGDEENARNRRFRGEQIPAPQNGSNELKTIVLKACAYDPKERYQTAKEMLAALEAVHTGKVSAIEDIPATNPASVEEPAIEEELTVGPNWSKVTGESDIDTMTVGPAWHKTPAVEEDATVGPMFQKKEATQTQTESTGKNQKTKQKSSKQKWWISIIAVIVCGVIGLSLVAGGKNNNRDEILYEQNNTQTSEVQHDQNISGTEMTSTEVISENDDYNISDDGIITLKKEKSEYIGDIIIPGKINGIPVTGIGNFAFADCNQITSIKMPDSVLFVGNSSFRNCTSLKEVVFSQQLMVINTSAFENCDLSSEVILPKSLIYIGSDAFLESGADDISVAKTTIYKYAIAEVTKVRDESNVCTIDWDEDDIQKDKLTWTHTNGTIVKETKEGFDGSLFGWGMDKYGNQVISELLANPPTALRTEYLFASDGSPVSVSVFYDDNSVYEYVYISNRNAVKMTITGAQDVPNVNTVTYNDLRGQTINILTTIDGYIYSGAW